MERAEASRAMERDASPANPVSLASLASLVSPASLTSLTRVMMEKEEKDVPRRAKARECLLRRSKKCYPKCNNYKIKLSS
jgi:hypothetical protein